MLHFLGKGATYSGCHSQEGLFPYTHELYFCWWQDVQKGQFFLTTVDRLVCIEQWEASVGALQMLWSTTPINLDC